MLQTFISGTTKFVPDIMLTTPVEAGSGRAPTRYKQMGVYKVWELVEDDVSTNWHYAGRVTVPARHTRSDVVAQYQG